MDKLERLAEKLANFCVAINANTNRLTELKAKLEAEVAARPRIVMTFDSKYF